MDTPFQAVIFDFDYTLADSSRGVVECVNYALRGLGLAMAPEANIRRTIGMSLPKTLAKLTGREDSDVAEEFHRLFVKRADEVMADLTALYETVPAVVRLLRSCGVRLGIVSTKFRYRIESILRRDEMLDYFDAIVGAEDVIHHKPNPEGLLRAMEWLDTPARQTLYVGDSVIDGETAHNAKASFVAVLSGVTLREEFAAYGPVSIVNDLHELGAWLIS